MSETVRINVAGNVVQGVDDFSLTLGMDTISTFQWSAPFDPEDAKQRSIYRPFAFAETVVTIGGKTELTGYLVDSKPEMTPQSFRVAGGGYAMPGILADCTAPVGALPIAFKDATIGQIAKTLCDPFGVTIDDQIKSKEKLKKVKFEPSSKILEQLVDLSKDLNILFSNNSRGDLVMWRAIASGDSVATLRYGSNPMTGITPTYSPQEIYSEVTGLRAVRVRSKTSASKTAFPRLVGDGVFRPFCFGVEKGNDPEVATSSACARMAANAASYTAEVCTWRDKNGNLWKPNTIVTLYAPGIFVYREFDFLLRTVTFNQKGDSETASLELVLPGSFAETVMKDGAPWE